MHIEQIVALVAQLGILLGVAVKLLRVRSLNTRDEASGVAQIEQSTATLLQSTTERVTTLQRQLTDLLAAFEDQARRLHKLQAEMAVTESQLQHAQDELNTLRAQLKQYRSANDFLSKRVTDLSMQLHDCTTSLQDCRKHLKKKGDGENHE